MNSTEDIENINILTQYLNGFVISKTVFTACEMGVFDLLLGSKELLSSKMISDRLNSSLKGMEKLLDACVALKLLKVERKNTQVLYGNTDLSNLYLAKSSPKSQYYYMMFFSESLYSKFHYLADAVREGKWQREKFDNSPKNIFEELYSSKENIKKIMLAMNASCSLCGRDVMTAFDLSHFPLICDVGDLPEVVKIAKKDFVSAEEHRINFCAVDFFKDPVPEADLYILARILLDWDDESCMELLTKVHKACKPGGGVLISEIVLNEDRSGPIEAHFASMLLLFYFEGKIRTPSELSRLLSATGFKEIQMKKTQSQYNVILARK
ncbi:acetylserotonin O-methyltransferase-like isoform X2 [Eublepharis macularius]|uniref:Acetylserotonin O-methyltransferase n=1 Tax=Eublepharis macularius TaxID=481883 RepID=A0AA97J2R3_EUBMA|nr:acetylserotonin O-methyltransferase-like isoform X2 [Eublepharis macularius]